MSGCWPTLHARLYHGGGVGKRITSSNKSVKKPEDRAGKTWARHQQEAKERIERYINEAEAAGAKVLVDTATYRGAGERRRLLRIPTVIDYVTPEMNIAKEEVFTGASYPAHR